MASKRTYEELEQRIRELEKESSKRQKAEEALRESEKKFRSLVEHLPETIVYTATLDAQSTTTYVSPQVANLLGYSQQDYQRDPSIWLKALHPDDREWVMAEVARCHDCGGALDVEYRMFHRNGRLIWWQDRAEIICNEHGEPLFLLGVMFDITARKRAEEKFRNIVNSSPMGIHMYKLEPDGRLVFTGVNPSADRILGVDNTQFIGKTLEEAFPPLAESEVPGRYRDVCANGGPWRTEQINYEDEQIKGAFEVHAFQTSPGTMAAMFFDITERKQAAEALRESQERFRLLSEASSEGIAITDKGVILDTNEQFAKMLGCPISELTGRRVMDFVAPVSRELVLEHIAAGYEQPYEHLAQKEDGSIFPVEAHGKIIPFEGRQVRVTVVSDISVRKQAEKALQDAEKRYRDFFNEAPVMYVVSSHHQGAPHIADCNELFCKTLGYTRDQILNRPLTDFYNAESQNQLVQGGYQEILDGRSVTAERHLVTSDGGPIETLVRSVPTFDSENKVIGSRAIYLDISKRKLAEEALRLSEEKFFKAFNASPVWVSVATVMEGRFLEVNDTFTKVTGYTRTEAIGRTSFELNFWLDPEKDRAGALERFHQQGFLRNFEIKMRFKGGDIHDMLWSADRLLFAGEDCLINVLIDITEIKNLQKEKATLENQLLQAQKMEAIGTLAGGIAHDFNNILSAILGNAEIALLHELPGGHPARYSVEEVRKAAKRARDLVRQILAFSRQKDEQFDEISLGLIIKEVVQLLRASLPVTIEIRQELTTQSDTIIGDPGRIHQVLMNLGTNAAHAMRKTGGILDIRSADIEVDPKSANSYPGLKPGAYLKLSVSDTGLGMSPSVRERIFEPYFTTKQVGEGTGLGLSVVHGIVKSLNGSITVASNKGQGSIFTILLPKVEGRSVSEIDNHGPMPTGTEGILFVDDEMPLTILGKRILEGLGYTVTAKKDGLDALETFRQDPHRYDLVITDMTMPGMTGDRLALEIMKIRPDIPVVLCTGYSESITPEGVREIGIRELVMKPLVMRQLAEIVRRVLDAGR